MIEHGIHKPFMITFFWRSRMQCKTKEYYEAAYNSQNGIDKTKDSIGDNLDTFIMDLKNKKYCFENAGLYSEDTNICFHFAKLTSMEEQEIQNPNSDFLMNFLYDNPDVTKTEMAKSDSKHKYVRSGCMRITYII